MYTGIATIFDRQNVNFKSKHCVKQNNNLVKRNGANMRIAIKMHYFFKLRQKGLAFKPIPLI